MPCNWERGISEEEIQKMMLTKKMDGEKQFAKYRYIYLQSLFAYTSTSHDMDREIEKHIDKLDHTQLTRVLWYFLPKTQAKLR